MGRKLVLNGTKLSDLSAPILPDIDGILPKAGALVLLDPTHPAASWSPGTPVHGQVLPNIAMKQAQAATGLTDVQVSPQMFVSSSFLTNNRLERSAKGGLHSILARAATLNTTTPENMFVDFSTGSGTALGNWILANKTHGFYIAKWGRWTRPLLAGAYTGGWMHSQMGTSNSMGGFFTRAASAGENAYGTTNRVGWSQVNHLSNTAAPYFIDGAWSPASHMTGMSWQAHRAARGQFNGYPDVVPSDIFYGYYVEDLTISGRTYSQVNALVKAKYTSDVLTTGGRYHSDTFTDPATIA